MTTERELRDEAIRRGEIVKRLRASCNLSQVQLAGLMRIKAGKISDLEGARYLHTPRNSKRMFDLYVDALVVLHRYSGAPDIPRPVNETTITRTPEASSDDLYEAAPASGNLAGGPTPPPVVPPAPFIHIPYSAHEAPTSDADAGRAQRLTAPTHGPRGLPFPRALRPYWCGWGDFVGDWIAALSLFGMLVAGLYIGAVYQ